MKNFEIRRDRFEFFDSFESPLLNITFKLTTPDFLSFCKEKKIPSFHFFLYIVITALGKIDNFKYRILDDKVIKIEKIFGSYTVLNSENLFNYTRFDYNADFPEFLKRSLTAREEAVHSIALINTGIELTPSEMKKYVFITSLPWLEFTSIQHPVFKAKSSDIPSVAWGKFTPAEGGKLVMPFSVQAHHGFVDGVHIHKLSETITEVIEEFLSSY